jgi:small-conductance mechanosensitive channel
MVWLEGLLEKPIVLQWLGSAVVVLAIVLVRSFVTRYIRAREEFLSEDSRRALSTTRNATFIVGFVALLWIWSPQLHDFALSVTAFVVAIVIATKELILCLSGGLWRMVSNAFRVGDWVEIGSARGEVVEYNLFSVTLQELGGESGRDYTGRALVLPNSLLLSTPVRSEHFSKHYAYHDIRAVVDPAFDDPQRAASLMLSAVEAQMQPGRELALRYNTMIERRLGIDLSDPAPSVRFSSTREARVEVIVSAFLPTRSAADIERTVIGKLTSWMHANRACLRK